MSMIDKYRDIIEMEHHVSPNRRPMPMDKRAAQFAPFAALNGHEEAIERTARMNINYYDERNRLD